MRRRIVEVAERPELWMGLLLAWVCLSALPSWHTPWARAAGTETLRWAVGIGLALALGMGLRRTGRMAQALTVCLGALVAVVLLTGRRPDGMITGPYGDHQLCASALLALLPFSVALALAAPRPAWRWAGQIIALAAVVCLALTQTRAAWAGGVAGGCVFACLQLRDAEAGLRRLPKVLIPGLLALCVTLTFMLLVQGTDFGSPLAARAATLGALGRDADWQWRLHTWGGVLQMISRHPLTGWGPGHYAAAHWPFTRLAAPIAPNQRPSLSDQAHDFYLQTAADLGLIGLGLYLAVLATFTRRALRTLAERVGPPKTAGRPVMRRALLMASLSLLAAQGVDALASPSWQFAEVSLLAWIGLGLGLAATRRATLTEEDTPVAAPLRRVLQCAAAGAAAVLLAAQLLPVGLLSPAEAYSQPAKWTLATLTITGSASSITYRAFETVTYTMTATYSYTDSGGQKHYTPPQTFTTGKDLLYQDPGAASNFSNNVLNITSGDKPILGGSKVLTIRGTLTDNNGAHMATTTLTIKSAS